MRTAIFDLLTFLGLGLVAYGAGRIYAPLWWIVPGLALGVLGLCGAYVFEQRHRQRQKQER